MDVEELVDVVNLKKLFVGNLPFTCTKEDLERLFSQVLH
jgi:RNA recognition motif-containing protein